MLNYVAAGVETYSTTSQIMVHNKPNEKEGTTFGKKLKTWRLRDKTVHLLSSSSMGAPIIDTPVDTAVPIFSASHIKTCGLTKILANPIHKPFFVSPYRSRGIESIVDSGGFQLLTGVKKFVHPDDVVAQYNNMADIGMPLDLPVRSAVEHLFFDAVSKMIRENDKYILKRLNDGIHLALISHGTTLKRRERRLDVLEREAEVVAVAGLNVKPAPGVDPVLNIIENLMYVVHRFHKKTRYFHVLGVTSKLWFFMYALLEAAGYVREIGADSVSHRMGALVGKFDTYDFQTISLNGPKVPNAIQGTYRQVIPCSCPVCSTVGDMRLINNPQLLEAHNLWARAKQTEYLTELAKSYLAGQITLKKIHKALFLKQDYALFEGVVKYTEEIMGSGKYRPIKEARTTNSLFGNRVEKRHEKLEAHYRAVIKRYEKFHQKAFL